MLWEHQKRLALQGHKNLRERGIVYYAMEMRVGKTLTALETARIGGYANVMFVTKKKAMSSIWRDYRSAGYQEHFRLMVTNYEQIHKYKPTDYDLVIVDEAHSLGAFPRPSLRATRMKAFVGSKDLILLSGTPTPESFSQIYHQFWVSSRSPFVEKNFYQWARRYVKIEERMINGYKIKDYSNVNMELLSPIIAPYFVTFTQKDAGFQYLQLDDEVCVVVPSPIVYEIVETLISERYVSFAGGYEIVADTAAKLLTKVHQIYSGTVICEDGRRLILDETKAKYILKGIGGEGIAIYYKYKSEFDVLRKYFPNYTTDPIDFSKNTHKVFVSQIQSGSMGIDLSMARAIVFYNIDFSFVNYWQARNRIQNLQRVEVPKIYWVFAEDGIEHRILDVVRKKQDYTTFYFRRDFFLKGGKVNV